MEGGGLELQGVQKLLCFPKFRNSPDSVSSGVGAKREITISNEHPVSPLGLSVFFYINDSEFGASLFRVQKFSSVRNVGSRT